MSIPTDTENMLPEIKPEIPLDVLIIDDEANIRRTLLRCLTEDGHDATAVGSAEEAMIEVRRRVFDMILLDLRLGGVDGMEFIRPLCAASPLAKIVIITAHATIESAVEAMRLGATDYLPKPFSIAQVRLVTARCGQLRALERELDMLRQEDRQNGPPETLESREPGMRQIVETARTVAPTNANLLLLGESGTGKTTLARFIHAMSARSTKPFGVISCPSIPTELLESEFFGHIRGAFTGAVRDNPGRIAACEGGTILLDEVADIPSNVQAKLLRFLQDKEYEQLGNPTLRTADVRVLAATNADLARRVAEGYFREDLFYRLNVVSLILPPLRERRRDIPDLARSLLDWFSRINHRRFEGFAPDALQYLIEHMWPGNLRELRNTIERAAILARGNRIEVGDLTAQVNNNTFRPETNSRLSLDELERNHIRSVLDSTSTLQDAATILGIDQTTLWRKRKRYGL